MPALTPRQDVAMKHKMKGDTDDRHRIERWDATRACSGHPVLLEPGEQAAPAILSGLFAVAWSIIGKEGVWRIGVDDNIGWPLRSLQGLFHLLDGFERDALVAPAVETEHGSLHAGGDVQWMERLQFTFATIFRISSISLNVETSPCREYNSGATAR